MEQCERSALWEIGNSGIVVIGIAIETEIGMGNEVLCCQAHVVGVVVVVVVAPGEVDSVP